MGNNSGKKECGDPGQKKLDDMFNTISGKKSHILRMDLKIALDKFRNINTCCSYQLEQNNFDGVFPDHALLKPSIALFQKAWSSQIDQELYANLESYLFKKNPNELSCQTFKKFFLDICKGDSEQKVKVLFELLNGGRVISGATVLKFITSIVNSILIIQEDKSSKKFNSWNSRTALTTTEESLNIYGNYFINQIHKTLDDEFIKEDLCALLMYFDFFLLMVLSRLYDTEEKYFYTNLLPKWKYGPVDLGRNLNEISVLDLCKIMFLNSELSVDFQHEWRILFSTSVHGESFSRLSTEVINKGPTIIIIKDKEGYIFGGFAPCSWNLGPTFFGDSRSFLFTLYPKMNLFVATNFNENYQYMNVGQQTMPNGLGMGGRLEYFGMWLNAEFGNGYCSESCTTYRNYKMMSGTKEFEISHLEIWGVGPPPPTLAELGQRSVLDGNLEAKAILEMAGKTAYSEGLREDIDN